jgi:hypothetical protein
MNRLIKTAIVACVSALVLASAVDAMAQGGGGGGRRGNRGGAAGGAGGGGGGNFDPAAMMQQRVDRMKETMGITNDDEWKVISERLTKLMQAQRDAMTGRGGFGGRGQRGGGGGGGGGGNTANVNPAVEALQAAIESGNADQIKAKMAAVRDDRTKKQAALKAAQEELKKVLNAKGEAVCLMQGLIE